MAKFCRQISIDRQIDRDTITENKGHNEMSTFDILLAAAQ